MGAHLSFENAARAEGGEKVGDITVEVEPAHRASRFRPGAPATMIDEYPILAVAAAFARGGGDMNGLGNSA